MLPHKTLTEQSLSMTGSWTRWRNDGEWDVCDPRSGERVWTYKGKRDMGCALLCYCGTRQTQRLNTLTTSTNTTCRRKDGWRFTMGPCLALTTWRIVCNNLVYRQVVVFKRKWDCHHWTTLWSWWCGWHHGMVKVSTARFFMSGNAEPCLSSWRQHNHWDYRSYLLCL